MTIEYYWDGENWLEVSKNEISIRYYFNKKLHRNDGPAYIGFYEDGPIGLEQYYVNGLWHRKNNPAIVHYNYNGLIIKKIFYENNKMHRRDGPAIIRYFSNSSKFEEYCFKGLIFNPKYLPFELPIDSPEKEFMFNLIYGE